MKVPTILAVLVAVTMTSATYAAPVVNGTFSDDDADLLSKVVKYNYEGDAELARLYEEAMYGNSTIPRANGVSAAAVTNDVLPYCVGIASGPTRARIFRNKITCNENGFSTLWTFTAHSKKDDLIAPTAMCFALSTKNPARSMYFPGKSTCKGGEWNTDFTFYESSQTGYVFQMWWAPKPDRIMTYPDYNGPAGGFTRSYGPKLRNAYRLAADSESKTLRTDYTRHLDVLKKIKVTAAPDVNTLRCAEMLIASSEVDTVPGKAGYTRSGRDLKDYPSLAFNAKCTNLIDSSKIVVRRVFANNIGSIELNIGKTTVAAISAKVGHKVFNPVFFRLALFESLRLGQPVMVGVHDQYPNDGFVMYVQGKMVVSGIKKIWNAIL